MAAARAHSSRDLPGGAFLGILDHDAHGSELVANAVGLLEILACASGGAIRNQCTNDAIIDDSRSWIASQVLLFRLSQQPNDVGGRLEGLLDIELSLPGSSCPTRRNRVQTRNCP